MNNKLEVIEHLEALGKSEIEPQVIEQGICKEMITLFDVSLEQLYPYFQSWDRYSGVIFFPIPGVDNTSPYGAYLDSEDLWIGEQGELRRSLCLHIAKKMRKEIGVNYVYKGERL